MCIRDSRYPARVPVDLHSHSRVSDGSDAPEEIVKLAIEAGLSAVALTDHDTQDGIERARQAAEGTDLELIPGAEISCGSGVHMVVLFLEPGAGPLQNRLEWVRSGRAERNALILGRLAGLGIDISPEELADEAGEGVVGRPHIAARLIAGGHVESMPDAFSRYLTAGQPGYVPRRTVGTVEAIRLALESGGVPVLAHPHTIDSSLGVHLESQLRKLADAGLVGIEVHYPGYDAKKRGRIGKLASRFGLLPSGGSDHHGTYKPHLSLGVGDGTLEIPEEVLEALRERAT